MTGVAKSAVCVLGTGLIGGSVLRAAVAAGYNAWGYNRSHAGVRAARADGFDVGDDIEAVLKRAAASDALIVLGVPMPAIDSILSDVRLLAPGCALTDVVSVKATVAATVRRHELGARYVGGHPMAGTAESGWAASTPDLFRGAAWAVGVDPGTHVEPWTRVARLALDCGAVVVPVVADEHDRAVARISHLPHVLAEALAVVGAGGGDLALGLAAGSFRDGTRVAATAPDLVRAICEPNAAALLDALDDTLRLLTAARDTLATNATLGELIDAGYSERDRYDTLHRWNITDIRPGDHNWLERLREAGQRGGVIRGLD
ncbi:prephenate dehydrogenase [Nocardia terpenica]|uniref:prephenate dehydrogenase n=1 Tax=Nocardia terpenica TaxID=455432 RepID=UPI00189573F9|nr:prephenate dehydrogenase [Nocardia terpenica]MBF6065014.1 prephenate dehydrogenase [Nocardia terpenica]MBF6108071.1 prephenate dehydrogenase [Nocardia terpenica]MBF6115286.1 prephenate dehydrogenase [Nocardia terpenica]MBF6122608.1 prephenate dehydrogenase [Nocardia terpenica]